MDPSRSKWDDDRIDQLAEQVSDIDKRQRRMRRTLRNRPTKLQVRRMIAKRSGPASNQAVLVAVIGFAGVVVAAVIAAYVQLKTNVPVPMPPTK